MTAPHNVPALLLAPARQTPARQTPAYDGDVQVHVQSRKGRLYTTDGHRLHAMPDPRDGSETLPDGMFDINFAPVLTPGATFGAACESRLKLAWQTAGCETDVDPSAWLSRAQDLLRVWGRSVNNMRVVLSSGDVHLIPKVAKALEKKLNRHAEAAVLAKALPPMVGCGVAVEVQYMFDALHFTGATTIRYQSTQDALVMGRNGREALIMPVRL